MRFLVIVFGVLFSALADAHVRWFVGNGVQLEPYKWGVADYLLLGLATTACLLALPISKLRMPQLTEQPFFKAWPGQLHFRLLAIVLGVWLLANFYFGEFIAPNLEPHLYFQFSLLLQAICGILLLINHRLAASTLCLYFLIIQLVITTPSKLWLDYVFELLAFALAISMAHKPQCAASLLRLLLGVQLIELGVHNKLLNPTMGVEFLQAHPWNFLALIDANLFTDANFIIGIGLAEVSLGVLLVAGICTRLVAAMVFGVFTLTGSLLGIAELLGHVPIVMAFIVVFSLGTGDKNLTAIQALLDEVMQVKPLRRLVKTS